MRRLVLISISALFLASTAVAAGTQINITPSGVSVDTASASAGSCSKKQRRLAIRIGGKCHNFAIVRDKWGNYVGFKLRAKTDTLIRVPRRGHLRSDCGLLWSTQHNIKYIVLRRADWWKLGKHDRSQLCTTPRTSWQAKKKLIQVPYRTNLIVERIQGSQSTGWHGIATGEVRFQVVYHGTVETRHGLFRKGQRPPPLEAGDKFTFWYNG